MTQQLQSSNGQSSVTRLLVLNGHLNATQVFHCTEQNCDPNTQGQNGSTPLHYASQGGNMNIIKYLITELGCDPTTTNSNGSLPLHIACLIGHLNATRYFIALNKSVTQIVEVRKWIYTSTLCFSRVVT